MLRKALRDAMFRRSAHRDPHLRGSVVAMVSIYAYVLEQDDQAAAGLTARAIVGR